MVIIRHYHDKFCIDKFSILNWTNPVISRNYEFIIMNFVINISQYVKTKTHNKPFVITFYVVFQILDHLLFDYQLFNF